MLASLGRRRPVAEIDDFLTAISDIWKQNARMQEIIDRLRRAKRAAVCFDRRIDLTKRPSRTSWTAEGSPLFDCSEPLGLRIRPQAEDPVLSVTLYTRPKSAGHFDANIYISSGTNILAEPLNCRPAWRRYAIPLHGISGPGAEHSKRGLNLEHPMPTNCISANSSWKRTAIGN